MRMGCKHRAVDMWVLQGPTAIGAPQMPNDSQMRNGVGAEGSDAPGGRSMKGVPCQGSPCAKLEVSVWV